MVSKRILTDLDFTTIEEYFNYLFTVAHKKELKALELYEKLSKPQKSDFKDWLSKYVDDEDAWGCICWLEE
jgi:hypothetical protein